MFCKQAAVQSSNQLGMRPASVDRRCKDVEKLSDMRQVRLLCETVKEPADS